MGKVINLNKYDVQSKGIYHEEGIAPTLYAGEKRYGGGECYVFSRQINTISSASTENKQCEK